MMHYLDNITLTILIILLRDGVLTISAPDADSFNELTAYTSTLARIRGATPWATLLRPLKRKKNLQRPMFRL